VASVLLVRPLQWWSSGLEALPTLCFDLLCLFGYVRYREKPDLRWMAVSAGALAVGLLFYEKPAYMPLYIALIQVLLLSDGLHARGIAGGFWRERTIWLAYSVVIAVWFAAFEASGGGAFSSHGAPAIADWLRYFRILWAQTLVPAMFGLRLPSSGLSPLQVTVAVGLELLLVVVAATSLRRNQSSWRAWVFLAAIVLATGLLVGEARLDQFGPSVGSDPRYLLDFSWLVPLVGCLAFERGRAAAVGRADAAGHRPEPGARHASRLAVSLAMIAYITASVATAAATQREWQGHPARVWEQHVQSSLTALERAGSRPVLAEDITPWFIVESPFSPYNQLSLVIPHYVAGVQVDGPLIGQLFTLDSAGYPHPADVAPGAVDFPSAKGRCAPGTSAAFILRERVPTPLAASPRPYYLLLAYTSAGNSTLRLYIDHGTGYPASPDRYVSVAAGSERSIAWLGVGSPRGLVLKLRQSGPRVCITRLQIVTLRTTG
jgi:hypothetical protein